MSFEHFLHGIIIVQQPQWYFAGLQTKIVGLSPINGASG